MGGVADVYRNSVTPTRQTQLKMEVVIVSTAGSKTIATLTVDPKSTFRELKNQIQRLKPWMYPERQEFRLLARGKGLDEHMTIEDAGLKDQNFLYLKDLGPQVAWKTVFLVEYAGPLFVYAWIYTRPWLFYGEGAAKQPMSTATHIAAVCWVLHYAKRLLETLFVHRFSHATMPIRNLFATVSTTGVLPLTWPTTSTILCTLRPASLKHML